MELHFHRRTLDAFDASQKVLNRVVIGLDLEAFLPVLDGLKSLVKLVASVLTEGFTHHFEPFISLFDSVRVNSSKVNEHRSVLLSLTNKLLAGVFVHTELNNVKFNLLGIDHVLLHLSLLVIELVSIIELFEKGRLGKSRVVEIEFVNQFLNLVNNVLRQSSDDGVLDNIVVEGVFNHLLTGFVIYLLKEDFASLVLPATKEFSRLDDSFMELFDYTLHLFGGRVVDNFKVIVSSFHADKGLDFSVQKDSLVDGQGSDDHLGDSVENATFPVLVVREHLRMMAGTRAEGTFFNRAKESSTNLLVFLGELAEFAESLKIKPVHQVLSFSDGVSFEVNLTDDFSSFNHEDVLLDVSSLREDSDLHFLELVDLVTAVLEVLSDREGEPVVVTGSLVHLQVESVKLSN